MHGVVCRGPFLCTKGLGMCSFRYGNLQLKIGCAGVQVELSEYTISSVTEGPESLAFTRCSIRPVGRMANEGFVIHAQVRADLRHAPSRRAGEVTKSTLDEFHSQGNMCDGAHSLALSFFKDIKSSILDVSLWVLCTLRTDAKMAVQDIKVKGGFSVWFAGRSHTKDVLRQRRK